MCTGAPSNDASKSSGSSASVGIAIGVTLGLALLIVLGVVAFRSRKPRYRKRMSAAPALSDEAAGSAGGMFQNPMFFGAPGEEYEQPVSFNTDYGLVKQKSAANEYNVPINNVKYGTARSDVLYDLARNDAPYELGRSSEPDYDLGSSLAYAEPTPLASARYYSAPLAGASVVNSTYQEAPVLRASPAYLQPKPAHATQKGSLGRGGASSTTLPNDSGYVDPHGAPALRASPGYAQPRVGPQQRSGGSALPTDSGYVDSPGRNGPQLDYEQLRSDRAKYGSLTSNGDKSSVMLYAVPMDGGGEYSVPTGGKLYGSGYALPRGAQDEDC